MQSPSVASENAVVCCANLNSTLSLSLYVGQICLICHLSCFTICTMDSNVSYVLIPLPKYHNEKLWRYLKHTKEMFIYTVHLFSLIFRIYRTHHHNTRQEGANYITYVNHITSGWKWTVRVLMQHIKGARRHLETCPIQCVSHAAVKRCSALVSTYSGREGNADHTACSA